MTTTVSARSALDPAPIALAIVAEAAWISVLAALGQAFAQERSILGVTGLAVFVAAGVVTARIAGPRLGERWPLVAVGLTLGAATVGWLASPAVREALIRGDVAGAFGDHLGGWLAGLATLRGFAHASTARSEASLGRLLGLGVPALAGIALLGGAVGEPWRGWFVTDAIAGVVVFLGSATLGLALARMSSLGGAAAFDWRRNRPWLGLLLLLVLAIAGVALPSSFVVGPAVQVAIGILAIPLLVVGLIAGFGYTSWRALAGIFLVGLLVIVAAAFGSDSLVEVDVPERASGGAEEAANQALVGAAAGGIALIVLVVGILILARLWMRDLRAPADLEVPEERTIDRSAVERPSRAVHGRRVERRRAEPTDAVGAYLALVADLADRGDIARAEAETPAEHARRVVGRGIGGLGLSLLAADYELARFGGVRLTGAEERRAVARWRRLRGLAGRDAGR